jgi:hypothetical protein
VVLRPGASTPGAAASDPRGCLAVPWRNSMGTATAARWRRGWWTDGPPVQERKADEDQAAHPGERSLRHGQGGHPSAHGLAAGEQGQVPGPGPRWRRRRPARWPSARGLVGEPCSRAACRERRSGGRPRAAPPADASAARGRRAAWRARSVRQHQEAERAPLRVRQALDLAPAGDRDPHRLHGHKPNPCLYFSAMRRLLVCSSAAAGYDASAMAVGERLRCRWGPRSRCGWRRPTTRPWSAASPAAPPGGGSRELPLLRLGLHPPRPGPGHDVPELLRAGVPPGPGSAITAPPPSSRTRWQATSPSASAPPARARPLRSRAIQENGLSPWSAPAAVGCGWERRPSPGCARRP